MTKSKAEGKSVSYLQVGEVEREWNSRIQRPPLKSLIDHIDHIAQVTGVKVALAWDPSFDGVSGAMPEGMDSAADLPGKPRPCSTGAVSQKQFSAAICLRVMGEVEKVSKRVTRGRVMPVVVQFPRSRSNLASKDNSEYSIVVRALRSLAMAQTAPQTPTKTTPKAGGRAGTGPRAGRPRPRTQPTGTLVRRGTSAIMRNGPRQDDLQAIPG